MSAIVGVVTIYEGTNLPVEVRNISTGTGLVSDVNGSLTHPSNPPASATDTGIAGTITWDANYIYVCIDTNVWKRVAITTW